MKRLTFEIHDGGIFVKESDVKTLTVEDEIIHTGNAIRKLAEYEDLEEQGMLLIVPKIKKNKTIYWIWGNEIMPVLFKRITSCVVDSNGNPHIMCEMKIKKDRTFTYTYNRKPIEFTFKAGDKRYFYSEDIGKSVFYTKEEAEAALKELESEEE